MFKNSDFKSLILERIGKGKILIFLASLILLFISKALFFIVIIAYLDFIGSYLNSVLKFNVFMTDILLVGIIIVSYALSPFYGLLLLPFYIITRLILAKLEMRYITKIPYIALIAFMAYYLNKFDIIIVGGVLFLLRYLLEYLAEFGLTGKINIERLPERVIHLLGGIIYFSVLGNIIVRFLRA